MSPRFVFILAATCSLLSILPTLWGTFTAPDGGFFIGFPYATDDHMVYSAWMRQAQNGQFLFDNRFTFDQQPGLTIHIYFFLLGIISKFVGIVAASELAKAALTFALVLQVAKLAKSLNPNPTAQILATLLGIFGAGFGFATWHNFGEALVLPNLLFRDVALGRLPTDVWQPEAFVFSSILTNGLFVASLNLILLIWECIVKSKASWKPVLPGAIGTLLLMNIHSYDVVLIVLVAVSFLVSTIAQKQMTGAWIARGALILSGSIPSALWLAHVLNEDPVFAARAATETYAPNFRQVLFGLGFLVVLAVINLMLSRSRKQSTIGGTALIFLITALFVAAQGHTGQYFLTPLFFAAAYVMAIGICSLISSQTSSLNVVQSWAIVGLIAPYLPTLFQRKLAMGLSLPWGLLAGIAIFELLKSKDQVRKPAILGSMVLVCSATSLLWMIRQFTFISQNVSRTTVQAIYVRPDAAKIIGYLSQQAYGTRVIAMPGIPQAIVNEQQQPLPDQFATPLIPDLNPLLSGFSGTYTFAGHWSETPHYTMKRGECQNFFLSSWTREQRIQFLKDWDISYFVAPDRKAYEFLIPNGFVNGADFGELVVDGEQFDLYKVDPGKLQ